MIYAAQFSKEGQGKYIVAGGSGANEAKVFDHKNGNAVIGKNKINDKQLLINFIILLSLFFVSLSLNLFSHVSVIMHS